MPLYVHEWDFFNAPVEKSHEVILIDDHAVKIKKLQEQVRVAYQRRGNDGIMTGHLVLRNDIGERTLATGAWIPLYRHPSHR